MPPKGNPSKKAKAEAAPLTTAQSLGSSIKSARDMMRKDKGLNGDLDRLPLLTWIMFLKFLDDLEQQRATHEQLRPVAPPHLEQRVFDPVVGEDTHAHASGRGRSHGPLG